MSYLKVTSLSCIVNVANTTVWLLRMTFNHERYNPCMGRSYIVSMYPRWLLSRCSGSTYGSAFVITNVSFSQLWAEQRVSSTKTHRKQLFSLTHNSTISRAAFAIEFPIRAPKALSDFRRLVRDQPSILK